MTLEEFETLSLDVSIKHHCELIDGVVTLSDRQLTAAHHAIVDNIMSALLVSMRAHGSRYRPVGRAFWLKNPRLRLATVPDVMIYEGRLFPAATSLDDPVVIFDIDTPGVPAARRAEKWKLYKRLRSLQHYVVMGRESAMVEVFERIDGGWFFRPRLNALTQVLTLPSIDVELPLADIYRDTGLG